jgi:hypothetical protein
MIILNDIKFESINCEKKLIFELIYMKKILFSFGLLSIITTASAQKGHDIKINFKNCKDTVMYLAFYQFDKSYLADTCKKIIKGNVVFKSPKTLERGVYYLVSQDKARYFEC